MLPERPDPDLLIPGWQELRRLSRESRLRAWAPYSRYQVGAAVRTSDGQLFGGCNVENASYGLTICAERTAVVSAVAAGYRNFTAICISLTGVAIPCGACRQFLYEFNPQLLIIVDDLSPPDPGPPELLTLSDLLPRAFRLETQS